MPVMQAEPVVQQAQTWEQPAQTWEQPVQSWDNTWNQPAAPTYNAQPAQAQTWDNNWEPVQAMMEPVVVACLSNQFRHDNGFCYDCFEGGVSSDDGRNCVYPVTVNLVRSDPEVGQYDHWVAP